MRTLGERLRSVRKERKLTQKALAAKVGMSQSLLSEIETGEVPTTTYVPALAHALGVHALWLDQGRGPKDLSEAPLAPPVVAEPPAQYGPAVSDLEVELLRDLRELLPEKRDGVLREVRALASEARAYKAMVEKKYGRAVPDEKVAQHLPPAPAEPPVERRQDGPGRRSYDTTASSESFRPAFPVGEYRVEEHGKAVKPSHKQEGQQ